MRSILHVLISSLYALAIPVDARAQLWAAGLEVKVKPVMREYCHIIRFSRGWSIQDSDEVGQHLFFDHRADYEFRVEGLLETTFLVGAFTEMVEQRYYTTNMYTVNLSDRAVPPVPVDRKTWEGGAVVALTRKSVFRPAAMDPWNERAESHGFRFTKTGYLWIQPSEYATRLSPDGSWLVLQSWNGKGDSGNPGTTKVFLDVFNTNTGAKVFTIEGKYSSILGPTSIDGCMRMTAWLTERYFIIPLGKHKETCLVCEFGGHKSRGESK